MNERLYVDIETDGRAEIYIDKKGALHPEVTKVHMVVIRDLDNPEDVRAYRSGDHSDDRGSATIADACRRIVNAGLVVGHNLIDFDLRVLMRLHPEAMVGFEEKRAVDTLLLSQLLAPERNGHSLKDWGETLGELKGDFTGPWDKWTEEMEEYCIQDTLVGIKIYRSLVNRQRGKKVPEAVIRLEHEVAWIVSRQVERGWYFDVEAAQTLIGLLMDEKAAAETQLHELIPPVREYGKLPQYYVDPTTGDQYPRKKDAPAKLRSKLEPGPSRFKDIPFNPGSGKQIAEWLIKEHGWVPEKMTEGGEPCTDESVLSLLPHDEIKLILKIKEIEKKLSFLHDRCLRAHHSRDGRIHGSVMTMGAVTHRMSHSQPNDGNVDKDPRVRGCYRASPGLTLAGIDAQGLELRLLANDMAAYDRGAFIKEVLEGDPHTSNWKAFKCKDRNEAKTIFYALVYGAQPYRIGVTICGKDASYGADIIRNFEQARPAYPRLVDRLTAQAEATGLVQLIDGRRVRCRKANAVLNTRLQGSGSVVLKVGLVIFHRLLKEHFPDKEWYFVGNIHDEWQLEVEPEIADKVIELGCHAIAQAGKILKLRCPMEGAGQKGETWADTH
jgi:DNA polymerase I